MVIIFKLDYIFNSVYYNLFFFLAHLRCAFIIKSHITPRGFKTDAFKGITEMKHVHTSFTNLFYWAEVFFKLKKNKIFFY